MNGCPHLARLHLVLLLGLLLGSPIHPHCAGAAAMGDPVATFEDIQYWVGQGEKRSALVIDWDGNSAADPALVWGYRWDGMATGADLLEAIVAADHRLFTKINFPLGSSSAIYGLGYDASDNGQFSLSDGTLFDALGVAITLPADGAQSTDSEDYYAEGWFTGFWHYGTYDPGLANGNPFENGNWMSDEGGMRSRELAEGSWDSWTFTQPIAFTQYAANPFAAINPSLSADFDADHDVDGIDFLTWQRGFSITTGATLEQGDANGDGDVDTIDLQWWSQFYGFASPSVGRPEATFSVPELSSNALALGAIGMCVFLAHTIPQGDDPNDLEP